MSESSSEIRVRIQTPELPILPRANNPDVSFSHKVISRPAKIRT